METYLGLDFGTSGARAIAIDAAGEVQAETRYAFTLETSSPTMWRDALFNLLVQLPEGVKPTLRAIAIDATSSTVLLCDRAGNPVEAPLLYNDSRGQVVLDRVRAIAPPQHPVVSATSSLAKLIWWQQQPFFSTKHLFLHQADWLGWLLHRQLGISDYNNALKLGYDPAVEAYPDWLLALERLPQLPRVLTPGAIVAELDPAIANRYGLPQDCVVKAGTTDSIAACLASGAKQPGEAVTSLGSTLVLKLFSRGRVDDARYGIYSHRLGDLWLTGGASNTGGAVLRQYFSDEELVALSQQIPNGESLLNYYPLTQPGERFPINDPKLPPRLEPRPADPVAFLHGLLESVARIEGQGYRLLQQLGATPLTRVYTAGGGAQNPAWTNLRQRHLQVPVVASKQVEAAYGAALLAKGL